MYVKIDMTFNHEYAATLSHKIYIGEGAIKGQNNT